MRSALLTARMWMLSLALAMTLMLSGCDNGAATKQTTNTTPPPAADPATAQTTPPASTDNTPPAQTPPKTILQGDPSAATPTPQPLTEPAKPVRVAITTNAGKIVVELDAAKAPITVANFLKYVDEGHYDKTIYHRVIADFMIQGGGFTAEMKEKPTHAPIQNEATNGLKNDRGTIAMARTGAPHSATSQFFINVKNNDGLNHTGVTRQGYGYCVFGKVVEGMDVVDKIRDVKTHSVEVDFDGQKVPFDDVPVETVLIESIKRVE